MFKDVIKKKGGQLLSKLSGGLITTVPMSIEEAKQMGLDLIKKKGGEVLGKLSGRPHHYILTAYIVMAYL